MSKKPLRVTIEWQLLERIAEFYEFPCAIFLGNMDCFKDLPKTREESLIKNSHKFDKIKEIVEE